jgi:hypothetical protein
MALLSAEPDEPTPEEMREALAEAQGWKVVVEGGSAGWVSADESVAIDQRHYRPDRDLGQALETAAALGKYACARTDHLGTECDPIRKIIVDYGDDLRGSRPRFDAAAEAALAITRYLYDRVRNAEVGS